MRKRFVHTTIVILALLVAGCTTTPDPVAETAHVVELVTYQVAGTNTAPNQSATAAIQTVIQKANQEQQDAFAKNNPALMQDTATTTYYGQLVQIEGYLTNGGVAAIKLIKLEWGPISIQNATTAQATTYETWQTTFADGTAVQSRDRNVYTVVVQNGA